MESWIGWLVAIVPLAALFAGRGRGSTVALVIVGIAMVLFALTFFTTGGQTTFTINEVILALGVLCIAAAAIRFLIVAWERAQATR